MIRNMSRPERDPYEHSSDPGYAVATTGLGKSFKGRPVVRDVRLQVAAGRVYGLLGPNGAGKSTTLKLLLGLLTPDSGEIRLFGAPWRREMLAGVGASIEGPALYEHLSAAENLDVHRRLLGLPTARVGQILAQVGLGGAGWQRVRTFSTGMKGRLALAIALLSDPRLLILDEPQNGLDPEGIVALRAMIRAFAAAGRTVIVSSHLLGEVAHLVDDVGVLVDGELRYQGQLAGLAPDGDLERAYFALTAPQLAGTR